MQCLAWFGLPAIVGSHSRIGIPSTPLLSGLDLIDFGSGHLTDGHAFNEVFLVDCQDPFLCFLVLGHSDVLPFESDSLSHLGPVSPFKHVCEDLEGE